MTQFKHFTLDELTSHPISKEKLITRMGLTGNLLERGIWFDYALPQEWVEGFLTYCKMNELAITAEKRSIYDLIISSTVWIYINNDPIGYAISGCSEVQWAVEAYAKESNL